jgi:hypothetical protein
MSEGKSVYIVARMSFAEDLLKGYGNIMAENEIISHCELLVKSGDLSTVEDDQFMPKGNNHSEKRMAF